MIRCTPRGNDYWDVLVANAVGIVAVDDVNLYIQPKIPIVHAVFLFEQSEQFPRLSRIPATIGMAAGGILWRAIAHWLVWSVEDVLRGDLRKDYRTEQDSLLAVRGRIEVHPTLDAFYRGSNRVHCEFDEFDADNALNRLLKAALRAVRSIGGLGEDLLDRAKRATLRFDDVGEVRSADMLATVDRNAARYTDALSLSKQVLAAIGRSLTVGNTAARCFLLRAPDLVESGIRNLLYKHLTGICSVDGTGMQLPDSPYTLNPDLVFGNYAVGDVKYDRCAIIQFCLHPPCSPSSLRIGPISVTRFIWQCAPNLRPEASASALLDQVSRWLGHS